MSGREDGVVAHFNHQFFQRSETFLYFSISNLAAFRPICLNWLPAPIVNRGVPTATTDRAGTAEKEEAPTERLIDQIFAEEVWE